VWWGRGGCLLEVEKWQRGSTVYDGEEVAAYLKVRGGKGGSTVCDGEEVRAYLKV
jgi:hypothetical protein